MNEYISKQCAGRYAYEIQKRFSNERFVEQKEDDSKKGEKTDANHASEGVQDNYRHRRFDKKKLMAR